jgi:hypothetical protein
MAPGDVKHFTSRLVVGHYADRGGSRVNETEPGIESFFFGIGSETRDPHYKNNTAKLNVDVHPEPDSNASKPELAVIDAHPGAFTGNADLCGAPTLPAQCQGKQDYSCTDIKGCASAQHDACATQAGEFEPCPAGICGPAVTDPAKQCSSSSVRVHGRRAPRARAAAVKDRVAKVQIALLRTTGTAHAAAAQWMWLKNAKAQFTARAPQHGLCNKPIWLTTTGTKSWKYSLTHGLPAGKYVLYSRAVSSAGFAEITFSAKDGNRRTFTVR